MNTLNIAIKEMKNDFRDARTLLFLLAFPIVLMLIMGTTLTNVFNSQVTIPDMQVLYKNTSTNAEFSRSWEAFTQETDQSGIHFKKVADNINGKKQVQEDLYTGYVEISDSGMHFFGSSKNSIESNIIQGILTGFTDQYNLASEIAKVDPKQANPVLSSGSKDDYIVETALNSVKKPGSLDYYAITMTTMIALFGAMAASHLMDRERVGRTAIRLMAAPITKSEIFIGKIMGSIVLNLLLLLAIVLFSKFVFKAYWGDHLGMVMLVLLSEVILAVSFGLGLSSMIKAAAAPVIMVFTQLAAFFGGAYFPIDNTPGLVNTLTFLSPIRWVNRAITQIIYGNDLTAAIPAICLNVGIAAVFLIIAGTALQKREGL